MLPIDGERIYARFFVVKSFLLNLGSPQVRPPSGENAVTMIYFLDSKYLMKRSRLRVLDFNVGYGVLHGGGLPEGR